jgi:succinate dehydrogenase / fumarate reductase cytochrome b subunit
MSLTGLFLCLFLVGHVSGNFQLMLPGFEGKLQFNEYAVFMTTNPAVMVLSYLTYFSILFHAIWSIVLTRRNKAARPKGYAYTKPGNTSSWASRNMGILGAVILAFIVFHMSDFWYEYKFGEVPYMMTEDQEGFYGKDGEAYYGVEVNKAGMLVFGEEEVAPAMKDLHEEVLTAFSNPLLALIYILAMGFIAFHLSHGFQSGFQSLGLNHPKYTPIIKKAGLAFCIAIPAGFALIAVWVFLFHQETEAGYHVIKSLI